MADAIPVHSEPKPTPKRGNQKASTEAAASEQTSGVVFIDFGPDDVKPDPADYPGCVSIRKIPTHSAFEVLY